MLEEVKELVAEGLGADIDSLTENTNLKEDLEADSLDLFDLVTSIEDKFDIEVPTEELENLITIKDIVAYIEKNK